MQCIRPDAGKHQQLHDNQSNSKYIIWEKKKRKLQAVDRKSEEGKQTQNPLRRNKLAALKRSPIKKRFPFNYCRNKVKLKMFIGAISVF